MGCRISSLTAFPVKPSFVRHGCGWREEAGVGMGAAAGALSGIVVITLFLLHPAMIC